MIEFQTSLTGMNRASEGLDRAASRIARTPFPQGDSSGDSVDLSAEMAALMTSRNSFETNVKVAQAEDQMSRSILSMLG